MSDWDFLHEMRQRGYSSDEIADAAGCGYAPWEEAHLSQDWLDAKLVDVPSEAPGAIAPAIPFRSREGRPYSSWEHQSIFDDLVACAERHFKNTGRYLQIWGELGEIYAEIKFGLRRHATHTAGSDGTIDGRLVEVKTISPEKGDDTVFVKSQGNFEQLLIVRIDPDFKFRGKLIDRSELGGQSGKLLRSRPGAV